jgi:hypothetical protein
VEEGYYNKKRKILYGITGAWSYDRLRLMFCYGILSVEMNTDSISGEKSNPHKRDIHLPLII